MKPAATVPDPHLQKLILENVSDIVITTNLQFEILSWNHIAEEFYGISADKALGKRISQLVNFTYHGTTTEQAFAELQSAKIWRGEVSFTDGKGITHHLLQTVKFIVDEQGVQTGILAVGRNITDRKRAEEQLARSEQFYRTLTADALDVTLLMNKAGEITFATPGVERLLGYKPEDVLFTNAFQYIHPEDATWAMESFSREVQEDPEIKFILARVLKKNKNWLWCMIRGYNMLNRPGVNGIAIYLHDDTPRKLAMDSVKQSQKRFRTLIHGIQIGVLLQDKQGNIVMTNHAMTEMFGLSEMQVSGSKIWDIYSDVIHEDGRPFLLSERPTYRVFQTKQPSRGVVMGVWHPQKRQRIWIIVSADPILDENNELINVVCSFTDITERKKLEKKIVAGKIAYQRQIAQAAVDGQERERREIGKKLHENIGQQLTSVKLLLDLLKASACAETESMVNAAWLGVSEVINEVRLVSRSLVPPSLKDLGLIDSVNDLIDSLQTEQPLAIELDYFGFDEDLLPENKKLALFRIIQEQLNNVLKHSRASHVLISLTHQDDKVKLQITDDGQGFDRKNTQNGLGLSNIANRAELFGGIVEIVTAPGHGCTLQVVIPHPLAVMGVEEK